MPHEKQFVWGPFWCHFLVTVMHLPLVLVLTWCLPQQSVPSSDHLSQRALKRKASLSRHFLPQLVENWFSLRKSI